MPQAPGAPAQVATRARRMKSAMPNAMLNRTMTYGVALAAGGVSGSLRGVIDGGVGDGSVMGQS